MAAVSVGLKADKMASQMVVVLVASMGDSMVVELAGSKAAQLGFQMVVQ